MRNIIDHDIAEGTTEFPIPVINDVDEEEVDTRFKYVVANVDDMEYSLEDLKGCDCEDECVPGSCACIDASNIEIEDNRIKNASELHNRFEKFELYECGRDICKCKGKCRNRLTPDKFNIKVELVKQKDKGFGVLSKQFIEAGTFVAEFVGELLCVIEANSRQNPSEYCFFVNHLHTSKKNSGHFVDPTRFGNIARFFNHSCLPNLTPFRYYSNHRRLDRVSMAFVAWRTIVPGAEITIDYGSKWWTTNVKQSHNFFCRCGWLYCGYPPPGAPQLTIEDSKKKAVQIIKDDLEKLQLYKKLCRKHLTGT
ncbi:SET domain-containing protein [Ditylenchus destructor]|nr:SET domain-containing protein [Ditylenchus destructor]